MEQESMMFVEGIEDRPAGENLVKPAKSKGRMIRKAILSDTKAMVDVYNVYVTQSTVTFETEPVTEAEMRRRIGEIAAAHPCFVCEEAGRMAGYCYAHAWKERAAYRHTWESTVYLAAGMQGRGIGRQLMERLIADCREQGCHALIACITGGNEASIRLHERLGFRRVSCFEQVGRKMGVWLDVVDYELLL